MLPKAPLECHFMSGIAIVLFSSPFISIIAIAWEERDLNECLLMWHREDSHPVLTALLYSSPYSCVYNYWPDNRVTDMNKKADCMYSSSIASIMNFHKLIAQAEQVYALAVL